MRFTMSTDEKKSIDMPSFVIAQPETPPPSSRKSKKTIIIAVTGVIVAILVLIAILFGVYMFTEAEKEIVKFTMQLKGDMKQDVYSNPNTNTVQLHVYGTDQETWMINDYNSDVSVLKIKSQHETNCFVKALNETSPMDIPKMKADGVQDNAVTVSLVYSTNGSPIKDTSFLSKTARDACSGISTYWLYPSCDTPIKSDGDPSKKSKKRGAWYVANPCNGFTFLSQCPFYYSCYYSYPNWHFDYAWKSSYCTGPLYYY